jgi:hypothetical protein
MTESIKIKAQDLFKAISSKYNFITKDEFCGYVKAWQFEPVPTVDLEYACWRGKRLTRKQLGYSSEHYTEEELNVLENEFPFILAGNGASQSWWEIKEFQNKPSVECIAERNYEVEE